jgi:long-chain acyl-CoA synthetase
VAHALLAFGIRPGDRVAIQAENRPEWLYTDLGTLAARATTVGLYPTNPAAEVEYLLQDSGARILIAEDEEQVDKALAVLERCPDLERVVYLEPRGVAAIEHPSLLSWSEFLERGRVHQQNEPLALEGVDARVREEDVATLVYTSGTTGPPKGAMLTHANVGFAMRTLLGEHGAYQPAPSVLDVSLSYLPLCHVAERALTTWSNAASGLLVHFAESIDTVQPDLREVQPSLFFAVPRIWEKLKAGVETKMASASLLKRTSYRFWSRVGGLMAAQMLRNGGRHTATSRMLYALGYPFHFRALRDRLGLRKVRAASSGAAPIAPEVLEFFLGMGIAVHEVYGMTENSAVGTVNRRGRLRLGTVGEAYPGTEVRLAEGTHEILVRHPGVFAGYWHRPEATSETVDSEGWLRTGDVGEWQEGTHLRIVDRIKDIIITAGGKNISPSEIENALKASPYIREAVVIGDQRPYLVALVGVEEDTVGSWARQRHIPYTTYEDLSQRAEVVDLVRQVLEQVNERFARVEQVRKFRMLTNPLDHESGELTATQKVRRAAMAQRYAELVEDMYAGSARFAGGDATAVSAAVASVAGEG